MIGGNCYTKFKERIAVLYIGNGELSERQDLLHKNLKT